MPWRKHNELTLNDAAGIAAAALAAASCVFIFHETPILLLSEIRPIPWFLTEEIEVIVTNVSLYAPRYERRFCLRPTIMQLDLQSVEKVPFSTLAWVFAPKMFEIGLPRLRMACSFLQDLSRAVPRFYRGPVAGSRRQHFFDPTGLQIATVFYPVGSKKYWRWFPATGPLEKLETGLDRSWRKLQVILRPRRPNSNIFGANAHANVLKRNFQPTANPAA